MMILIRDVKGNELELDHGCDVYLKDTRSGQKFHFEWLDLPKMFLHDLASRAIRTMEQARELITASSGLC